MKDLNPSKSHQDFEHAISHDNSSLLQKFHCRPCSVQLFEPKMAPKKNQNAQKVPEDRPMRITRRRATLGEAIVVERTNPENPPAKIVRRRASTAGTGKRCESKLRSVKLSNTGN